MLSKRLTYSRKGSARTRSAHGRGIHTFLLVRPEADNASQSRKLAAEDASRPLGGLFLRQATREQYVPARVAFSRRN